MSEPINIRLLGPGTRVVLEDGAVAEIVSNPLDGVCPLSHLARRPRQGRQRGNDLRTRYRRDRRNLLARYPPSPCIEWNGPGPLGPASGYQL